MRKSNLRANDEYLSEQINFENIVSVEVNNLYIIKTFEN